MRRAPLLFSVAAECVAAVASFQGAHWFTASFAPMRQQVSQCTLCARERDEEWVCGSKTVDEIRTNEYSDWIDGFFPARHRHIWIVATSYDRSKWFGPLGVGCGGITAFSEIYGLRIDLGENDARLLVAKFHQLAKIQSAQTRWTAIEQFSQALRADPRPLLDARPGD